MRILIVIIMCAVYAHAQSFQAIVADTFHSSGGGISTSPVNQATGGPTTANPVTTTVTTPTSGNLLLLQCAGNSSANTVSGITGTVTVDGNGWRSADISNTNRTVVIYYAIAAGAGTTVIITFANSFSGVNYGCNVSEWSGANTTNALDGHGPTHTTGAAASLNTATVTPAASGDLCVAVSRVGNSVSAPTNSYTAMSTPNSNFAFAYLVPASTSTSTGWTFSSATADAVIACFKP